MDKLLCELQDGGAVWVKPDGAIHINTTTALGIGATCVIDRDLLDVLARHWMDLNGIEYRLARLKASGE